MRRTRENNQILSEIQTENQWIGDTQAATRYCFLTRNNLRNIRSGKKTDYGLINGTWCSGITSASHAEGPGFKSQWVQCFAVFDRTVEGETKM